MKKVFYAIVFVLTSITASAQLEVTNVIDVISGSIANPDDNELQASWDVVNMTDAAVSLRARREVITAPPVFNLPYTFGAAGARERFCWGALCFDYGTAVTPTNQSLLVNIQPGESNDTFKGLYEHMGTAGQAHFRYCFFDVNNSAIEVCHEVLFCVDVDCVVGIAEQKEPELGVLGPNPVQGVSTFTYDFGTAQGQRSIAIYNMVGSIVREVNLQAPAGMVYINADDFEAGVYFYALVQNGQAIATRKFVVTK
jgi:hypothetical protein